MQTAIFVSLFQVLGLAHDFSPEELRKAYRSASLQYHPDKRASGSADAFARVATAHAVLSDVGQRLDFDTAHGMPASNASPENVKDGLGPFLWDEVEELYFPEAVGFVVLLCNGKYDMKVVTTSSLQ